jgi:RimJ/RimL family protein N-acetyltransferase
MARPLPPVPPILRDGELVLRSASAADVEAIRKLYSEPDVRRWMGWDDELPDAAEARRNIERAALAWEEGTWAVFRVALLPRDEVVGGANLRLDVHETAEISYFLRRSARGRGLATRAVRLLSAWAFEQLGIERLELRTHLENEASQKVAERAGFRREGVERASRAWPDGTRFDSVVYSLLPGDHPRG